MFSILIPTEVFAAIEVHYNYYPAPDISIKSYSGTSVTIRLPKYSSIGMRRGGSSGEDDDDNWISIFLYDDTGRLVSSGYIAVWSDKEYEYTFNGLDVNRTYKVEARYGEIHAVNKGRDGNIYYSSHGKLLLTKKEIQVSTQITPLAWDNVRGRGRLVLSWNNDVFYDYYRIEVFNGYKWEAFPSTLRSTWDSQIAKIYPSETTLDGYTNNSQTTVFVGSNGGNDLADNPNKIYNKTIGTEYNSLSKYRFRVYGYKDGLTKYSQVHEIELPNRTDVLSPTGTISIQNGANAVSNVNVTLNVSATDTGGSGVAKMRFRNSGGNWSAWETYATTKTWTLISGSGLKVVEAQFMDNAGNESLIVSDDIMLDTTLPTGSITINNGATYATNRNLTLTLPASDNIQVSKMKFKVDNGSWGTPVNYTTPYTLTISPGDGTRTVYVKFIDSAGNESGAYSDTIILDESIPIISNFTINNNAEWGGAGGLTLNIDATDNGTGISEMQFSNDNATWSSWETFAGIKSGWQSTPGNGVKTVYVRIRDKAGNISSVVSATIKVDTVKPTGSVVINDGDAKVGTINVKVKVTASDDYSGVDKIALSKDGITWGQWLDYSPNNIYSFQLEGGVGNKYCYLRVRDKAGNISDSIRDDIYLKDDNEAPNIELKINNGAEYTLDVNVKLTINVFDDLTPIENLKMRFSDDGINWTIWEQVSFIKDWVIANTKGLQRVFMQTRDDAGNIATTGASISYYPSLEEFINEWKSQDVDISPPTIKSFKIANGASIITSSSIGLSIIAEDNSGTEDLIMCFSSDGENWTTPIKYKNNYTLNKSIGSGYRTIYVKITDRAGNNAVGDLQVFVK